MEDAKVHAPVVWAGLPNSYLKDMFTYVHRKIFLVAVVIADLQSVGKTQPI